MQFLQKKWCHERSSEIVFPPLLCLRVGAAGLWITAIYFSQLLLYEIFYAQPYMQNGFLGTQAMINVAVRACSKKYWKMFTVCHGSTSIASLLPPLLLLCCIWHCNVYKPFTNNLFGLFHSKLNIQKVHQIQYHFLNVL